MSSISACMALVMASALVLMGTPAHSASFLSGKMGAPFGRASANDLRRFAPVKRTPYKRSGSPTAPSGDENEGFLVIAEAPPKLLEARQHGKTVLECSASGNPAPQITWFKDGKPLIKEYRAGYLDNGDYGSFAVESLSETKSKISLDCVSEQDAGLYECVAHSAGGRKTSVGTEVHVVSFEPNGCTPRHLMDFTLSSPVIYQWMGTYLQLLGTDAHLICRAEGHHKTLWKGPMDEPIEPSNGAGKYKVLPNGDLIINNLTFEDMGMYKCEVSNANGADMKETFLYPHAA